MEIVRLLDTDYRWKFDFELDMTKPIGAKRVNLSTPTLFYHNLEEKGSRNFRFADLNIQWWMGTLYVHNERIGTLYNVNTYIYEQAQNK